MTIHFNNEEYYLDVWKNEDTGKFYIREPLLYSMCRRHRVTGCKDCDEAVIYDFDNRYTIGNMVRWVQAGKADYDYSWNDIKFYSGSHMKHVLDMRCDEFMDSEARLPVKMSISFVR